MAYYRGVPPNYREQQGRPLTGNERKGALALAAALVAAGTALGAWSLASGGTQAHGPCVTVVVAGPTGGGYSTRCGNNARHWCGAQLSATGPSAEQAQRNCRVAGLLPPS